LDQQELVKIIEELREEVAQLRAENAALRAENERLKVEVQVLRLELDEARREGARQAAPFRRRDERKLPHDQHKPPGRKPGHPGAFRSRPAYIDQSIDIPLPKCPRCGGPVRSVRPVKQWIEELPPVRPLVVELTTYAGECACCGDVSSTHPLQTSTAEGAAAVQLGPRALALAAMLNKEHGLTLRKTACVLKDLCGLRTTPGGLAQSLARIASKLSSAYERLCDDLRGSAAVFADETSWWVGGPGWWLWTFTTPQTTCYRVENSRGSNVVAEVLGKNFKGTLVSDCLASYNPAPYRKHKCIAHHLRAIKAAERNTSDRSYLLAWKVVFDQVCCLHRERDKLTFEQFAAQRTALEGRVQRLLDHPPADALCQRIHARLSRQRAHLLGCLYEPAAEPTNNRAERALRPAVIARKLSCGNKTIQGRDTWQILTSLAVTCRQRAEDFISFLAHRLPVSAVTR
jgi:transposase